MCTCTCMPCRSGDNVWESVLFFHYVGPTAVRLGDKHLHPESTHCCTLCFLKCIYSSQQCFGGIVHVLLLRSFYMWENRCTELKHRVQGHRARKFQWGGFYSVFLISTLNWWKVGKTFQENLKETSESDVWNLIVTQNSPLWTAYYPQRMKCVLPI